MRLSDYLIEAVASKKTGKYFDFDKLNISSASYEETFSALSSSSAPKIQEMDAIMVLSLIKINKNSDALKELVKIREDIGGNSNCMWSPSPTGENCLYFFYIENFVRATVWKMKYNKSELVSISRTSLPSGKTSNEFHWNSNVISDMIRTISK